jgi:hypothetical protein
MAWLLSPPSIDEFLRLLRAWKFWIVFTALGAFLGAAIYFLFPPDYRASAVAVVDFNVEEAWSEETDRKIFYYLDREARKVEEVAWADETLEPVAAQFPDLTVASLRQQQLHLSQPEDGAWHFYADDPDPVRARQMVGLWTESFEKRVQLGAANALALQNMRKTGKNLSPDETLVLEQATLGISPYVEVYASQSNALLVVRKTALGEYAFFGATGMLFLTTLGILFFGSIDE